MTSRFMSQFHNLFLKPRPWEMGKKSENDPAGSSHHFHALACTSCHIHLSLCSHPTTLMSTTPSWDKIHDLQNSPLARCGKSGLYRTDQMDTERCALLLLTSSSQTADSQVQNPIFHIWHSTDPTELSESITALQESNKTEFLSTPTRCKAAQRRGSWKSKRKAREYNA